MATVQLRNVNPLGQVDLPIAGRQGDPLGVEGVGCLEPGEVFEVDATVAGHEPKPAKGEPGDEGYEPGDLGEGLLAQVGNFERVKSRKPAATDGEKA